MRYAFVENIDGVDTIKLREHHPELFNVKVIGEGGESWTLRPDVRASLCAAREARLSAARQEFFRAKAQYISGGDDCMAAVVEAARALKAVLDDNYHAADFLNFAKPLR
jgi:hypothetical protein